MPHLNIWEYFAGVGLLIAGFLYLLVRKAGKETRTPIKPKKEGKVVNLDDYEKAISGDLSHLEEVQSNGYEILEQNFANRINRNILAIYAVDGI